MESMLSSKSSGNRSGLWILALFLAGSLGISALVAIPNRKAIRERIILRRVGHNAGLRHYDLAMEELLRVRDAMLEHPEWQSMALEVMARRDELPEILRTARMMVDRGVENGEWFWQGWRAATFFGQDHEGGVLLSALESPEMIESLDSARRTALSGYGHYLRGDTIRAHSLLERAEEHGVEPGLLRTLRVECLLDQGRATEAGELLEHFAEDADPLPRMHGALAAYRLSQGWAQPARASLDYFRAKTGGVDEIYDAFLDRIASQAGAPESAWNAEMLSLWREDRKTENSLWDPSMPEVARGGEYPPLPAGDVAERYGYADLIEALGGPGDANGPLPETWASAFCNFDEPGSVTLILRAGADRRGYLGAMAALRLPDQSNAYTYFASPAREERRLTFRMPAGETSITLNTWTFNEDGITSATVWLDEIILVRQRSEIEPADLGTRDFLLDRAGRR